MRNSSKILAAAAAVAAIAASGAAQAQSVDVSVVGTIIPTACTPTLAGGGVVDFGKTSASTLNQTDFTLLKGKSVPFEIACDAPAKIALEFTDNRASSLVPGVVNGITGGLTDDNNFALGAHSGANVGGFTMAPTRTTYVADGNQVWPIRSDGSGGWIRFNGKVSKAAGQLVSWSDVDADGSLPVAFQNLSGMIGVHVALNKGEDLPLENDVPLDGNATITLVYL